MKEHELTDSHKAQIKDSLDGLMFGLANRPAGDPDEASIAQSYGMCAIALQLSRIADALEQLAAR